MWGETGVLVGGVVVLDHQGAVVGAAEHDGLVGQRDAGAGEGALRHHQVADALGAAAEETRALVVTLRRAHAHVAEHVGLEGAQDEVDEEPQQHQQQATRELEDESLHGWGPFLRSVVWGAGAWVPGGAERAAAGPRSVQVSRNGP